MPLRMNGKKSARQISAGLGSILLDTLGLTAAIEWHAHRFQKRTGVPEASRAALERAFRVIFRAGTPRAVAAARLLDDEDPWVRELAVFIAG